MGNQSSQFNPPPTEPQDSGGNASQSPSLSTPNVDMPPSGDNVGRQMSNETNRKTRWLIIAALLVLALGLGTWVIWRDWSLVFPPAGEPAPVDIPSVIEDTNIEPSLTSATTSFVDTSNWQTYRNEQYGFEFQYPNNWVQCVGIYPKNFLCVQDSQPEDNAISPDKLELFLADDFFKGVANISQLKTYLENQRADFGLPVVEKRVGELIFVLAGGCDAGCNHRSITFLKNGKLLEISYSTNGEISTTKDQILSTFRFIE